MSPTRIITVPGEKLVKKIPESGHQTGPKKRSHSRLRGSPPLNGILADVKVSQCRARKTRDVRFAGPTVLQGKAKGEDSVWAAQGRSVRCQLGKVVGHPLPPTSPARANIAQDPGAASIIHSPKPTQWRFKSRGPASPALLEGRNPAVTPPRTPQGARKLCPSTAPPSPLA